MANYRNVLVLLAAFARAAPRCAAGPPIHAARPPCGPSVPQSRAQRWRASVRAETRSKRPFTHSKIESALAPRESGYHPPNSPRHTIVTAQGFGESGGPRSAPRAPFCPCQLAAASRPACPARTSSAPRRPRPSPVSPRVFRALRGARVAAHVRTAFGGKCIAPLAPLHRRGPASTLVRWLLYYSQVRSVSQRPARRGPAKISAATLRKLHGDDGDPVRHGVLSPFPVPPQCSKHPAARATSRTFGEIPRATTPLTSHLRRRRPWRLGVN